MKFIIYSPAYNEDSGGVIALHKLCALLNQQGHRSRIWLSQKPTPRELFRVLGWKKLLKYSKGIIFRNQELQSPYNLKLDLNLFVGNSIVIYPEIIEGNPLRAKNVVRWLLNKPGVMTGIVEFEQDELTFFYDSHFNDPKFNHDLSNHLNVVENMKHTYKQVNFTERHGCCHMIRKGQSKIHNQHPDDSILIDGKSHKEIAEIFNQKKYFVSYDPYSMFSSYAAICGCTSIVIPDEGVSKEKWKPNEANRYGIAYGWDDIDWALSTRDDLELLMANVEGESLKSVQSFVDKCEVFFL